MELTDLGWDAHFTDKFNELNEENWFPARVAQDNGKSYRLLWQEGELRAEVAGRLRHEATASSQLPAVGDWVAISPRREEGAATIHAVLLRRSAFSRKVPGEHTTEEQIVAANVDIAFLVMGLDRDFNVRRLERYLTLAWDSGATPVIALNKADTCADVGTKIAAVEAVAGGVSVHAISAVQGEGVAALKEYLQPGKTAALLGSSGVGKSTLANCLSGLETQQVGGVRENDGRGRHTTTHRELVVLPNGAVLIDNPGMRELQLWADEEGLKQSFEDVESLAASCRFADCAHGSEPGCAVHQALETGELGTSRLESYLKLQREMNYLAARQEQKVQMVQKERGKQLAKFIRGMKKSR